MIINFYAQYCRIQKQKMRYLNTWTKDRLKCYPSYSSRDLNSELRVLEAVWDQGAAR